MGKKLEISKKIVGIDFSLTSTGICVYEPKTNSKEFILVYRKDKYKKIDERITSIPVENSDQMVLKILQVVRNVQNLEKIGLEGISYRSTSSSFFDLNGFNYVLQFLLRQNLKNDVIIVPPRSVKKKAGSGNYKKEDMIARFVLKNPEYFWFKTKKPYDDLVDSFWVSLFVSEY